MVEEEKEKRSLNLLSVISKTIDRQVLGLATTIAWYNHHRAIVFPKDNLFEVTVGGLRYTGDLERLEDCYNKEEKYWKRFSEKSREEKRFLTVENLLSLNDVPSAVKEFVEKNDTTGGGSFLESSGSVGNKIVESKKSFSPLQFSGSRLTQGVCSLREEERGKAVIYGPSSHQINSTPLVQQVYKGPRIRLTARKRVPNQFEKFTFSIPAHSGSPSQDKATSNLIRIPDPRGKQAQACDPCQAQSIFPAHAATQPDSRGDPSKRCYPSLEPVCVTCDPRAAQEDLTRGVSDPRVFH